MIAGLIEAPGNWAAPYDAKATANALLDWADRDGISVTPLKIQKLLFYCHANYLTETSSPFISEIFEAWSYGPVIPSVYQEFKEFSQVPIKKRAMKFDPISCTRTVAHTKFTSADLEHLRRTYDVYINVPAGVLSAWTHRSGGAWAVATAQFEKYSNINRRITNDLILRHHCIDV